MSGLVCCSSAQHLSIPPCCSSTQHLQLCCQLIVVNFCKGGQPTQRSVTAEGSYTSEQQLQHCDNPCGS